MKPLLAITMGDPSGIGPEIISRSLADDPIWKICTPFVIGDTTAMARGLAITGSTLRTCEIASPGEIPEAASRALYLLPVTQLPDVEVQFGKPTAAGGDAVHSYIVEAARLCMMEEAAAMVTAPINKEAMNRAGHHYPGHTELLAELTGTSDYVMMLAGDRLRVTLVTIHEALRDVPRLLSTERVLATIRTTHRDLDRYFKKSPRLAILSLNPHCGEGGMFGDEEAAIIAPAIAAARREGIDAVGPLSADTLFHFAAGGDFDAVVCMYHDQGLIPLKLLHFDDGVNVTLGLPIIRTSVDHGTAYDIAGTGTASAGSMTAAIKMAAAMAAHRVPSVGQGEAGR